MKIGNRREERVEDMEVEEAGEARAGGSRVVEGEDVLRQIDEVLGTYERKEPTDQVQTFLKGGKEGEENVGEGKKIGGGGAERGGNFISNPAKIHTVEDVTTLNKGEDETVRSEDMKNSESSDCAKSNSSVVTVNSSGISYRKRSGTELSKKDNKRWKGEVEFHMDYEKREKLNKYMKGQVRLLQKGAEPSVAAALEHRGSTPFGVDKRLFLVRHSNCKDKTTEMADYNSSGSIYSRHCKVCDVRHWSDDRPRIVFLGDQSIPAVVGGQENCCIVERVDNARLYDLYEYMKVLLTGDFSHLSLHPDSVIAVFSLADLVRLGVHGYMAEFERFRKGLTELISKTLRKAYKDCKPRFVIVPTMFPSQMQDKGTWIALSEYWAYLKSLRELKGSSLPVLLPDIIQCKGYRLVEDVPRHISIDGEKYSPGNPEVTFCSKLLILPGPPVNADLVAVHPAIVEGSWLEALMLDANGPYFLNRGIFVPSKSDIDHGLARYWSLKLGNMKSKDKVPESLVNAVNKHAPVEKDGLESGRIILVGTSNMRNLKEKLSSELSVEYVPNMVIDISGTEDSVCRGIADLKPTRTDVVVLGLLGNSFLVSADKNGIKRLTGSKETGHLINPAQMDEDLLNLNLKVVAKTAVNLSLNYPARQILVMGPFPRFVECCDKHVNSGLSGGESWVLDEIDRVDGLCAAKLEELAGIDNLGANVKYVPSMEIFGQHHHTKYLGVDKVHLSPDGLRILGDYLSNILGIEGRALGDPKAGTDKRT